MKWAVITIVFVLLAVGCSTAAETDASRDETGAIDEASDVGVFRLRRGDCVNFPTQEQLEEGVEAMQAVPCDEMHDAEVLDLVLLPHADDAPYPGRMAIEEASYEECIELFDRVTPLDYVTDPDWDVSTLYPSDTTWERIDDREVICFAVPLDRTPTSELIPRV